MFLLLQFLLLLNIKANNLFKRCRYHDDSSLTLICKLPPTLSFQSIRSRIDCSIKCLVFNNYVQPSFTYLPLTGQHDFISIDEKFLVKYDQFQFESKFLPPSVSVTRAGGLEGFCFGFNFDPKIGLCEIFDNICVDENIESINDFNIGMSFYQMIQNPKEMCYLGDYHDCKDINSTNIDDSGLYWITYDLQTYPIYCEISPEGVKYTVIQRRIDGSINFTRNWTDYENGFGNVKGEFWIGNSLLHALTTKYSYKLRVEIETFDNVRAYAEYKTFVVGSTNNQYMLSANGYSGDAGDSLAFQNGMKFSTIDVDNDIFKDHCAQTYKAGWWYKDCHRSNPNGLYQNRTIRGGKGICWATFRGLRESLKSIKMMIFK